MNLLKTLVQVAVLALTVSAVSSHATSISLYTLPGGATIVQITDALDMATGGGLATGDTRTAYYFEPDFGDPAVNFHDFTGTTWPYVYIDGALSFDSNITANIATATDAVGDFLLINGNPVYQFIHDNSSTDANGNFGPWFFITADGTATQSTLVPLPAALPLLLSGLIGFGLWRKKA